MLKDAFVTLVTMQGQNRQMTFYASGSPTPVSGAETIPVAPSSFFASPAGPADTVGTGREFVVVIDHVRAQLGRTPKRGDRMMDWNVAEIMAIDTVREMVDVGGAVMGYRIRTED